MREEKASYGVIAQPRRAAFLPERARPRSSWGLGVMRHRAGAEGNHRRRATGGATVKYACKASHSRKVSRGCDGTPS